MTREEININLLMERIRREDIHYSIEEYYYEDYKFFRISGHYVIAGVATNGISSDLFNVKGRIAIGPSILELWKFAPLSLYIPINNEQREFIIKQLIFWGSKEGINICKNEIKSKYVFQYPLEAYGFR